MRRFGRENVENASADGILTHHLDRLAPLVTDCLEMLREIFERNLLAYTQLNSELPVKLCRFRAEHCRGDWHNRDRNPLG